MFIKGLISNTGDFEPRQRFVHSEWSLSRYNPTVGLMYVSYWSMFGSFCHLRANIGNDEVLTQNLSAFVHVTFDSLFKVK